MSQGLHRVSAGFMILVMILTACSNLPAQIVDDSGASMALVPAGGEASQAQTASPSDFYIDAYKVTNQAYAECVGAGACAKPEITASYEDPAFANHPVIFVTWPMAQAFCEWRGARLSTLAEWEKAAADDLETVEYFWGDKSPTCQVGARMPAASGDNPAIITVTEAVGSYGPNAYGLYDMTSGVWEWVGDGYGGSDDPTLVSYSDHNLVRGISWDTVVSFLRIARHSGYGPVYVRYFCGFRCARSP